MSAISKPYKASLSKTQGRHSYSIIFRHPVRKDPNTGESGRRVRAGLGTRDEAEANALVSQMNELLANSQFWTKGAEETARGRFNPRIVDAFFRNIVPQKKDFMDIREQVISIPSSADSDYRTALLLGTTGAGKTTLLRQIIGTHPDDNGERFPSTSVAKTTVADTEIIVSEGDYHAAVTFMEQDEVRDYLEECISAAVLSAYQEKSDSDVLRRLLQHVDQRMRFNYVLGGDDLFSEDDLDDEDEDDIDEESNEIPEILNLERTNELLISAVKRVHEIANNQGANLKASHEATGESDQQDVEKEYLDKLLREDREYHSIADDLMDEIELRFSQLTLGDMKPEQGWPVSWEFSSADRGIFIKEILRFSSNYPPLRGTLLTPLVNGIRVKGPFFPKWAENKKQPIVIVDGEGLGHTPDSSSSLSNNLLRRINAVDAIILVDDATQPMQAAPAAALRTLVETGNIKKLLMCFTHFDETEHESLPTVSARKKHVLDSAENVIAQLGKDLGVSAERALRARLDEQRFFLENIHEILDKDEKRDKRSIEQMRKLLVAVDKIIKPPVSVAARPVYAHANLVLAIREATVQFHQIWRIRLGLEYKSGITKEPWAQVKALSRRLAILNQDEYKTLKPVADLRKQIGENIYCTIQEPIDWEGDEPDEDSKQQIYDDFFSTLTERLLELAKERIWTDRFDEWNEAFNQSGRGSTVPRAKIIASIYDKAVPIPKSTPSLDQNKFLDEVLALVEAICEEKEIKLKSTTSISR